jgi:hypothetical protein
MLIHPDNQNGIAVSEISRLCSFVLHIKERNFKANNIIEYWWNKSVQGEQKTLGEKLVPVSLFPPQSLQRLTGDLTRASAVRCQRLKTVARLNYK